jgi:[protein-PII] uridylyltransferase
VSRWVQHFPVEPKVSVTPDRSSGRWLVSVSCADRPGLLSAISRVLLKHGLNLVDARVTTLGARAEDVFVMNGAAVENEASRGVLADELR